MSHGVLLGVDETIATWTFETYQMPKMKYDRALGIVDGSGKLLGSIIFQSWNGHNVELSYYGPKTMTVGIVRYIAKFVIEQFDVSRVTVTTNKRNRRLMRAFQKLGFRLEGGSRCFYGKRDCNRNTGVRFVMFREQIEKLARWENTEVAKTQC